MENWALISSLHKLSSFFFSALLLLRRLTGRLDDDVCADERQSGMQHAASEKTFTLALRHTEVAGGRAC